MEPSEEIRSVVQRFFEALRDGDEEAVSSRISRLAGFERYGSDPNEWWRDGEETVLIYRQQTQEMGGGYPFEPTEEPTGYREGSVGWGGIQTWIGGRDARRTTPNLGSQDRSRLHESWTDDGEAHPWGMDAATS
jgi:hypothetical protein